MIRQGAQRRKCVASIVALYYLSYAIVSFVEVLVSSWPVHGDVIPCFTFLTRHDITRLTEPLDKINNLIPSLFFNSTRGEGIRGWANGAENANDISPSRLSASQRSKVDYSTERMKRSEMCTELFAYGGSSCNFCTGKMKFS